MKIKPKWIRDIVDILIPLLVMLCIIYLNYKGKAIGREYVHNATQALFVTADGRGFSDKDLETILLDNMHITTKKIEMYDDNLKPMFQISFTGNSNTPTIDNFHGLRELIINEKDRSRKGQATVQIDEALQSAYYEWIINSENEDRVVIVYSALDGFKDYWFIDFIAYGGVVLTIFLVVKEKKKMISDLQKKNDYADRAIEMINQL